MSNGDFIVCRTEGIVCTDCKEDIKIGDMYSKSHTRRGEKEYNYTYCKECKGQHVMKRNDYDGMYHELVKSPMFKDEFRNKYGYTRSRSNIVMRELINKGYDVRIFRWTTRSYNKVKVKYDPDRSHTPNTFIIYYAVGTENKVLLKLMDTFDYERIRWRDLINSLFGMRVPYEFRDKDAIIQWANQNVFN